MKLMKKLLSICLAMIMTLSMVTVSVGAEEKEEPIVKILTLSDYQKWLPNYSGDDWSSLQTQLTGLVNGAYNAGVDPDYMIFGGDYSCMDSASLSSTGKSQVDSIIQSKWPHLKGDNMFVVQGNHDPEATDGLMETTGYETDDFIVYLLNEDIYPSKQGTSDAKGITVDKIEVKNGHVELVMTYSSAGQYSEFNGNILFYGTVQEAVDAGLNLDIQLVSTGKDKTTIGKNELLNMGDSKLVIVEEAMVVQMPSDIVYASENTNMLTGKKAKVLDTEEAAYFILK